MSNKMPAIPKKIFSAIIILVLPQITYASEHNEELIDKVIAVVEGEPILLSEMKNAMAPFMDNLKSISDPDKRAEKEQNLKELILDQLINKRLLNQQLKKLGIKVSDHEVDLAVKDILQRNNLDMSKLKSFLEQQGQSLKTYREQVRKQLARLKLINMKIKSQVKISDEDIENYIAQNISKGQEEVHAQHILLTLPKNASEKEVQDTIKKAKQIAALARKGENFTELAKKYSQGPSGPKGGDLGFFKKGQMVPAFEKAAFALKPGEISGPVRTAYGIHIIKVLERRQVANPDKSERDKIKQKLFNIEVDKKLKAWLDEIKKKVQIEYKL
ncbi:MAG: peptidylprolyl isomerase [Deltaproteobacteria bacterium]|nr:peptidylprolyl isomerase [Deltaproteobacteria bacterium]